MLETMRSPLRAVPLLLVLVAVTIAVALYCIAYTAFAGRAEPPAEALAWPIVNVLPWLAAFEAGKRSGRLEAHLLILGAALFTSLLLGTLTGEAGALGFELTRRVPGLLITSALLAVVNLKRARRAEVSCGATDLPLDPKQIHWIAAAGNYVELHGSAGTRIHRAPLSSLQGELARHGFVRVHRSTLVRRDLIARVRPLDILLRDGTSLRTGKRYRAHLTQENFIPLSQERGGEGL